MVQCVWGLGWLAFGLGGAAQAEKPEPLPPTCYLFSYFVSPGTDGLHLAWSRDGFKWQALKGGRSFLQPTVGEKIMRDPSLLLGPDGIFRLVWTEVGRPLRIGYASSKDLITWSAQEEPKVMASEPTARNCWAPIVDYDEVNQRYQIVWSSTIPGQFPDTANKTENDFNHRFYVATTTDFKSFAPAKLFYDPGFCAIDATILQANHKFYLIFKNETDRPFPQKNLWMATSDAMAGPYGNLTGTIATNPSSGVEGPTAIKIGDSYFLYYDCYYAGHLGVVQSDHLHVWKDVSSRLSMPVGIRHGSVLAVPSRVIENLLKVR